MITSEKDYNELLYLIDDPNNLTGEPTYYRIPADEPIYYINLNTREVQTPNFISVLEDHNAEVIWFKVDRFYDDVDLYNATCWIQYKNAVNEDYISVSIPKVINDGSHDILYLPWVISNSLTKAAGKVTFSFQFFKIDEDSKKVFYSINTKPATGTITNSLHVNPDKFLEDGGVDDSQINPQYSKFMEDYRVLTDKYTKLSQAYELYWLEIK